MKQSTLMQITETKKAAKISLFQKTLLFLIKRYQLQFSALDQIIGGSCKLWFWPSPVFAPKNGSATLCAVQRPPCKVNAECCIGLNVGDLVVLLTTLGDATKTDLPMISPGFWALALQGQRGMGFVHLHRI